MMTELQARAFTPEELAERYLDHDDLGVRRLANDYLQPRDDSGESLKQRIENLESDLDAGDNQRFILRELLQECLEVLPDEERDLVARVKEAL